MPADLEAGKTMQQPETSIRFQLYFHGRFQNWEVLHPMQHNTAQRSSAQQTCRMQPAAGGASPASDPLGAESHPAAGPAECQAASCIRTNSNSGSSDKAGTQ